MSPRAAWRLETLGFASVYDYLGGKQDWLAVGLPSEGEDTRLPRAGTVARPDVPTCQLDEPLDSVRERVRGTGWDACVVMNDRRVVLGILRREDLDGAGEATAEGAMRPGPSTFRPNVSIEEMAEHMVRHGTEDALITTSDGRLVGLLLREDAVTSAHSLHAVGGHGDE